MRIVGAFTGALMLLAAVALAQPEEGLVIHYTFTEGTGEVVRDKSGHGFDGKIVHAVRSGVPDKAEWVQEKGRKTLRLDGWTHVNAGTKPNALMGLSGTLEIWCMPEELGGGLISWNAGVKDAEGSYWPGQRLVLAFWMYQDSQLGGWVADGIGCTRNGLLYPVETKKWGHFALTYGQGEPPSLNLFVNGERVRSLPQTVLPDIKDVPLRIGYLVEGLVGGSFVGRIADARIYNRALSAEEIRRRYAEGVRQLGVEVPPSVRVTPRFDVKSGELTALCDLTLMPDLGGKGSLSATLRDTKGNALQEKNAPIPAKADSLPLLFATATLPSGLYEISVSVTGAQGRQLLKAPAVARWYLPEIADKVGAPPERKILNNLVTQLAAAENMAPRDYQEVPFVNPRKGWVFISTTAQEGGRGLITVAVDAEKQDAVIVQRIAEKPTMETMRLLSAGEHKLRIWAEPEAGATSPAMNRLVVRAVPAMMQCNWPSSPFDGSVKNFDFAFLARDVLPNINTLIGVAADGLDKDRAAWKARGGRTLLESSIPTKLRDYVKDVPNPLTADFAYDYWTKNAGFTNPYFDGVMADEVNLADNSPDFPPTTEALRRIVANPAYKDKSIFVWGGGVCMPSKATDFMGVVLESGNKFAPNTYLAETPTMEEARAVFDVDIRREVERFNETYPGVARDIIMNLSFMSSFPLTCNLNPSVDFKVFLDMQFQHLASSPECLGLWGVMLYKANYADEEYVRWAGRLFRHYGIEGRTELLSDRYGFVYNLKHIKNADFDQGAAGWQIDAAEQGSVKPGHMAGLHELLGRYHGAQEGNNFLVMKRSGQKPNRASQEIAGLKAGKLYSVKMVAGDYQDFVQARSEKKRLAVSLNVEGADVIAAKVVAAEIQSQSALYQFAGKTAPWINYRRIVFRATAPAARVVLSDWADATAPGGPAGQEIFMNFIEIQPYLED